MNGATPLIDCADFCASAEHYPFAYDSDVEYDNTLKSNEKLAGAPGFEPGNGGIKIQQLGMLGRCYCTETAQLSATPVPAFVQPPPFNTRAAFVAPVLRLQTDGDDDGREGSG